MTEMQDSQSGRNCYKSINRLDATAVTMDLADNKPERFVVEDKGGRNKEMRVLVMGLGRSGTTGKAPPYNS